MKYQQKRFSVMQAGDKATWPDYEPKPGCDLCGAKGKLQTLKAKFNDTFIWACAKCKEVNDGPL